MGSIGMPEMMVIVVIALIIFGPRKLPELGKSLGKSIAEFKRAIQRAEEHARGGNQGRGMQQQNAAESPPSAILGERRAGDPQRRSTTSNRRVDHGA